MRILTALILSVIFLCVSSCANVDLSSFAERGGLGGTGKAPGDGGLGGTGLLANNPTGGLGGTGKVAPLLVGHRSGSGLGGTGKSVDSGHEGGLGGTGIVGVITGFGSIWVNNAHIHFDDDTPIRINNRVASSTDLKLGQVAAVLSDRVSSDYQARTIDIVHEVIGPFELNDLTKAEIKDSLKNDEGHLYANVLSQSIAIKPDTRLLMNEDGASLSPVALDTERLSLLLEDGAKMLAKVSGLRAESGVVQASRIDFYPLVSSGSIPFQVMGKLDIQDDQVLVAGLDIEVSPVLVPDDLSIRYMVQGVIENDHYLVEDIGVDSTLRVIEEADDFVLQGVADLSDLEDSISIAGLDLEFNTDLDLSSLNDIALQEELVQFHGDFEGDRALIEDFSVLSDDMETYVDILHELELEHELDEGFEFEEGQEFDDYDGPEDFFDDHWEEDWEDFVEYEFDDGYEFEDDFEFDEDIQEEFNEDIEFIINEELELLFEVGGDLVDAE